MHETGRGERIRRYYHDHSGKKIPRWFSFLQYAKTPVVLVNRHIRSLDLDIVRIDNYRGGYMAAAHLLEKGHRKIAHLSGAAEFRRSAGSSARLFRRDG